MVLKFHFIQHAQFFFLLTHYIKIIDQEESPVHFTCPSVRANIKCEFNILLWSTSLCKLLEYSRRDIHTLTHNPMLPFQALPRSFQHKRISTSSLGHKSILTSCILPILSISKFTVYSAHCTL